MNPKQKKLLTRIIVALVLFVIIAIRVATLPGAAAGYEYLLVPRWEALLNPTTWVYALGQAFFSLSLAGCGTLVYGSYLKRDVDVVDAAKNVAIFDTIAGLVAACVVVPAVFAFGLDVSSGPPLLFITLAQVFQEMPFGNIFAVILFAAVVFAAITSLMNLFEAPVEALQAQLDKLRSSAQDDPLALPWVKKLLALGHLTELDRPTVAAAIREIRVYEGNRMEIDYLLPEGCRALLEG